MTINETLTIAMIVFNKCGDVTGIICKKSSKKIGKRSRKDRGHEKRSHGKDRGQVLHGKDRGQKDRGQVLYFATMRLI
jgi:hypothetical protein